MRVQTRIIEHGLWPLTAVSFAGALVLLVYNTPVDPGAGSIQKMFYLHLPTAVAMLAMAMTVFVASLGYLWQKDPRWDDLAHAAGELTVLFGAVVLLTGMVWARGAWGHWWEWNAPLTFSLVLLVLYAGYVAIRPFVDRPGTRATVSALYGVAAFFDVPLIYVSLRLMPDRHASSVTLDPAMRLTLLVWFVPVSLLAFGLLRARFGLNTRVRLLEGPELGDSDRHASTNGVAP